MKRKFVTGLMCLSVMLAASPVSAADAQTEAQMAVQIETAQEYADQAIPEAEPQTSEGTGETHGPVMPEGPPETLPPVTAATEPETGVETDTTQEPSIQDPSQQETAGEEETELVQQEVIQDAQDGILAEAQIVPETERQDIEDVVTEYASVMDQEDAETEETAEMPAEEETEAPEAMTPSEGVTGTMQEIYSFSRESIGLNHAAACGLLSNIMHESAYNTTAVGDSGTSYGLCQWHNERYSALMSYCGNNGLDYNSVYGQMSYLLHELNNGYQNVLSYMRNVPDNAQGAYDSAYYWCMHFEMPADTAARSAERGSYATDVLYGKNFAYAPDQEEISYTFDFSQAEAVISTVRGATL